MQNDTIKRYLPVHGIGTFICSNCIIESSKNYILDEFPEVIGVNTHADNEQDSDFLSEMAIKCLTLLAKKFPPTVSLFFLDGGGLLNNNTEGTIFIGCNHDEMNNEESKPEFIERVKNEIMSLNINKDKIDEDMDDTEKSHYKELFEMGSLSDIFVTYSDREDENEVDDIDIGYEEGMIDGMEYHYNHIRVVLYKMYRKKKIKDLDFLLEEIKNTIAGMGEDFKVWEKNFKKWLSNNKKKESHLEDDIKKEIN